MARNPSLDPRAIGLFAVEPRHLAALRERLGDEAVVADPEALARYGRDETEDLSFPAAVAVRPTDVAGVAAVLALAARDRLPVTPRGAGTGLSGGALPVYGGIVLSLERLDRIRAIDPLDLVAEVEVGVTTAAVQEAVAARGLFYPPDPASKASCTVGGNLAEDSAGPRSCKYGTTGDWVLGLEAVLADGTVTTFGGRNRKDVAGYDLVHLLVGSEGTLAVLTAATLRLIAQPARTMTLLLPFDDLAAAAGAVARFFHDGFQPAACELLDRVALEAVGRELPLPAAMRDRAALLCLELDGDDEDALLAAAEGIAALAAASGGGEAIAATEAADQRRLWAVRERVGSAVKSRSLYKEADTVVPRGRLADLVEAAREVARRHGLTVACYGHAGDGNLHVNLLRGDLDAAAWPARRDAAEADLFAAVASLGGSITGEHGVGWVQRRYLPHVVDPAGLALLRRVKAAFDPLGILNPGKVLPP